MKIGYIARFPDGDAIANDEGSIMVFGSRNDLSNFLDTADGEEPVDIVFHEISYDEILREINNVNFALNENAFNIFRKAAGRRGINVSKQDFSEINQGLIKFATLSKKTILH